MSRLPLRLSNDRDDTHDKYTTSLRHRSEQASAYYRTQLRDYSRPSSSSESAASGAPSLRRTARFEARPSRLRSSSVDSPSPSRLPEPAREPSVARHHRRSASAHHSYASYKHPALRVSSRTHAAVTYALEEGLRKGPHPFTPDLVEENADMSDLGGGRATNGGARTGGPIPVSSAGQRAGVKTPVQIMRERNAREAQRLEEQKLAEERRRSAERRAQAAVPGAAPRFSQASSQYSPDVSTQQAAFDQQRRSGVGQVAGSDVLGNPTSRSSQVYPDSRTRGPSVTQQDQPRPAPATSGTSRRAQPSARAATSAATAGPSNQPSGDAGAQPRTGASSFPHAFQRWEDLSSHWEGLTSYWLHKLEQNTEEIRNTVPNAVTLNRQITDLSAAGANLFHAVVELQRLRASSERKFQRWFFESKNNEERMREMHGQLENQLQLERGSRDDTARQRAETSIQVENARREVAEMRRELMISKDEARRAWEELGRRNQESLETAQSLKEGRVTMVHGLSVVPYMGGPSRSASASQRPGTRDGQPQYGSTGMASGPAAAGLSSPGDDREYYQQEASPTNTDPFTEVKPLQPGTGPQSLAAGTYYPSSASPSQRPPPASAGSLGPSRAPAGGSSIPVSEQEAARFYQHPPRETFLHSAQSSTQGVSATAGAAPPNREDIRSEVSYVDSEGDIEYDIDAQGNYQVDELGRPIPYGSRTDPLEGDDQLTPRYGGASGSGSGSASGLGGTGIVPPEAPSVPSTSAQAMQSYGPPTATSSQSRPTYEGEDYDDWEPLQAARHHHPTRLSDVLEEEEERSSRRTGD